MIVSETFDQVNNICMNILKFLTFVYCMKQIMLQGRRHWFCKDQTFKMPLHQIDVDLLRWTSWIAKEWPLGDQFPCCEELKALCKMQAEQN